MAFNFKHIDTIVPHYDDRSVVYREGFNESHKKTTTAEMG